MLITIVPSFIQPVTLAQGRQTATTSDSASGMPGVRNFTHKMLLDVRSGAW